MKEIYEMLKLMMEIFISSYALISLGRFIFTEEDRHFKWFVISCLVLILPKLKL